MITYFSQQKSLIIIGYLTCHCVMTFILRSKVDFYLTFQTRQNEPFCWFMYDLLKRVQFLGKKMPCPSLLKVTMWTYPLNHMQFAHTHHFCEKVRRPYLTLSQVIYLNSPQIDDPFFAVSKKFMKTFDHMWGEKRTAMCDLREKESNYCESSERLSLL